MPDSSQASSAGPARRSGLARLFKAMRAKPDLGQLGVGALIAALGFAAVEQVQLEEEDLLDTARRSDLIEIFTNLQNQSDRLEAQARELRDARTDLLTRQGSEEAAREQAQLRQQELGLLAGTLPASGPGVIIRVPGATFASDLVTTIQELRVAGAEAIQIRGDGGDTVRVGVDSYFLDAAGDDAIIVDAVELETPLEIRAIGEPGSLAEIQVFLGDDIAADWRITEHEVIGIDAVREPRENDYARPAPVDD